MAAPLLDDVVVLVEPECDSLAVLGEVSGGGVPVLDRLLKLDLNTIKISFNIKICLCKETKFSLFICKGRITNHISTANQITIITTDHLFNCQNNITTLNVRSLWKKPIDAARFLKLATDDETHEQEV